MWSLPLQPRALPVRPAILTSSQSDRPCAEFTPKTLLAELNHLSTYNLPLDHPEVKAGVDFLIANGHDFGTAYAWFRTARSFPLLPYDEPSLLENAVMAPDSQPTWWLEKPPSNFHLPDLRRYDHHLMESVYDYRDVVQATKKNGGQNPIRNGLYLNENGETVILNPSGIQPRRLWDLWSNRIVPYDWQLRQVAAYTVGPRDVSYKASYCGISHSWTADMRPVSTAVNKRQWGVPMPDGVMLETLREELLATLDDRLPEAGIEYCWLDVLCLRQATGPSHLEEIRVKEWKVDVPTIGNIYRQAKFVARYMNGLGRQFQTHGWESQYHWTQRAWTIQEVVYAMDGEARNITVGLDAKLTRGIKVMVGTESTTMSAILRKVPWHPGSGDTLARLKGLIRQVHSRFCANESDKVAALTFLLALNPAPVYNARDTLEAAWAKSARYLPAQLKIDILCEIAPIGGRDFPTWAYLSADPANQRKKVQATNLIERPYGLQELWVGLVYYTVATRTKKHFWYRGPGGFSLGLVRSITHETWDLGLREPDEIGKWNLCIGEVRVQKKGKNRYYVTAQHNSPEIAGEWYTPHFMRNLDHTTSIADGCYTLLRFDRVNSTAMTPRPQYILCEVHSGRQGQDSNLRNDAEASTSGAPEIHLRRVAVLKGAYSGNTNPGLPQYWALRQKLLDKRSTAKRSERDQIWEVNGWKAELEASPKYLIY